VRRYRVRQGSIQFAEGNDRDGLKAVIGRWLKADAI